MKRTWLRSRPRPGSGIPQDVRDQVLIRDGAWCVRCGVCVANVPSSLHHRLPRGRGGDASPSGLLLLCGSGTTGCHGQVESRRSNAYDDGLLCRTGERPANVPVLTHKGWRFYTDDFRCLTVREQADENGAVS